MPEVLPQPFQKPLFSPKYVEQLLAEYTDELVDPLVSNWHQANLPQTPGEALAYVRLNEGRGEKPVLYVPGFTEGIVAKAPFAAELALLDNDVILPNQNRKAILKDTVDNRKSATYSQAVNYLAVIEAEGLEELDIVTHSYGSLIFEKMVQIAKASGSDVFKNSKVIMLAPAGFSRESYPKLMVREIKELLYEGSKKKAPKQFDHPDMLKAGLKNATANLPRTIREVRDLVKNRVDAGSLLENVGSLAILSFASDMLFSGKALDVEASKAVEAGVRWAVPILQNERFDPSSSKPPATHNDEQYNPYRAAASVDQLLRQ
jgi:pimeloyl-ACP methyl ester carboxylesterase